MIGTERTLAIEALSGDPDFVHLGTLTRLAIDLRYASTRNLLGRDLYAPHDCAWLHVQAAEALQRADAWLARERPELRLLVLDAARPQRVQEQFWARVKGTPMQAYFAPPERGSIHSFGMAVDLTLVDAQGVELDLGTPFDDTSELSHPALEHAHEAAGRLSANQLAHRRVLRAAMLHGGWQPIASEWWHFDCGDRDAVRQRWRRIV
ncbi:MAG: hypothetical protein AMXMBFR78_24510 [Rubrivivax sp.]